MRLLPLARLLRIPNVFTAFADVALGLCVALGVAPTEVTGEVNFVARTLLLFLASGCLYCAGMVWNDYFDLEEDARDRPFRPLPSGVISTRFAFVLGTVLLLIGTVMAVGSGQLAAERSWTPAWIGGGLALAVLFYDGILKRTPLAPLGMGLCRFLNVLLGLTLVGDYFSPAGKVHLSLVIGIYIVGVTWFARTEEKRSDARVLKYAGVVMLIAVLMALAVPVRVPADSASILFPYLLMLFAFVVGSRVWAAIESPTPQRVQAGVKRCILGLIFLDAILGTVFVGTGGLLVALLLPPGLILGRWVYST
jgi:4-hydroxybenzoate polyprenyltransferase